MQHELSIVELFDKIGVSDRKLGVTTRCGLVPELSSSPPHLVMQ